MTEGSLSPVLGTTTTVGVVERLPELLEETARDSSSRFLVVESVFDRTELVSRWSADGCVEEADEVEMGGGGSREKNDPRWVSLVREVRGRLDVVTDSQSVDIAPSLPSFLSGCEETMLGVEESDVVRGASDGEVLEEEGEAELAEGFGDEEEMGRSSKMVGIRGREGYGSSDEDVSKDSFENLEGHV